MSSKSFQQVLTEIQGKPILVANRGISAQRICRSIRERLNALPVLAVTDFDNPFSSNASRYKTVSLGPDPNAYLDIDLVIKKAKETGAIAIHPGWGFSSENEDFPKKCLNSDLIFIGPSQKPMGILGNKVRLRALAQRLKIPIIPGSDRLNTVEDAKTFTQNFSYPFLLKAENGGGGIGIAFIQNEREFERAFFKASSMAQASFNNAWLYVEKYLENARHIEIQVIADNYGNVFAFDERDCSIQRNRQKLVEITPSPWPDFTNELRERLKGYARKLVEETGYASLATVEFLVDPAGSPYLIEVNARLQVEHGVTECRYGVDLVEEQIAVAFGAELRFTDANARPTNAAMQVRINCEDPQNDFMPNAGTVIDYVAPGGPGVRLDSTLYTGCEISPRYDSAAALLITYGQDWEKIRAVMKRALDEHRVEGVKTTIPFFKELLKHPKFQQGEFTTSFICEHPEIFSYSTPVNEGEKLARLMAEISACGYNPYVQLGKYRSIETPRLPWSKFMPPRVSMAEAPPSPYPKDDKKALLDMLRDSKQVHFTDTTTRDNAQSNSNNRFRLAEDAIVGPYLDRCGFFSLETGGGAHFHVAMLANKTNPFHEARAWNTFAPNTAKQLLVRSTNLLGYRPHPKNLMEFVGAMLCEDYHVFRCFDFLNHIENMIPLANVILRRKDVIFEPTIALSWTKNFTIQHYLEVAQAVISTTSQLTGLTPREASRNIILGLKDMAGACPPRFIEAFVKELRKKWPDLVLHYHRHNTDGLFVPAVGAAAKAGVHIIDVALDAATRSFGQGPALSTAAYLEEELNLETCIRKEEIRNANFALKQILPYYDKYCSPYVQGSDYDVVRHGMPGGAVSSSQEGIFKQGYVHLLPQILKFLEGTRNIVLYHDVTPGSQITWNTAFLNVVNAYKRGGDKAVNNLLETLHKAASLKEEDFDEDLKAASLLLYQNCNDAFRDLLLGKFGKLPLGFPPDWVYKSAFGDEWKNAIANRKEGSPLEELSDINFEGTRQELKTLINREPTKEELAMCLSHPADAVKTILFQEDFGDPNNIPLHVWFEGAEPLTPVDFFDAQGQRRRFQFIGAAYSQETGTYTARYALDSALLTHEFQLDKRSIKKDPLVIANALNPLQVAAPANGELWAVYVKPGDLVKKGEELFNISIMKQEKAVTSPINGTVKKVLKTANYKETKETTPVLEGELIIELEDYI